MKSLDQLDAWIANKVRAWSSRIPGTPKNPELLEIRRDILNDVRDHIEPRGEGKSVFPYNTLSIHIAAQDSSRRTLFEQAFTDGELAQTIAALVAEAGARQASLEVSVAVTEDAALASSGHAFRIDYANAKSAAAAPAAHGTRPNAKLTVIGGEADAAEYAVDRDRVNIGRMKEVVSDKDGLRRRNDVSFAESESTVSREHAFIRFDRESNRFRLYDDKSQRGTIVFRDGRRFVVPKGPAHGFELRSGDEIHLGSGRLRFEIESASI
jgi:FHA domain